MFYVDFDFQIVTYKSLGKSDIFIYTDLGGYYLVLPEYLGFFRKIQPNNLLNNLKRKPESFYMYPVLTEGKKETFINNLINKLQINGFKVTLMENKR